MRANVKVNWKHWGLCSGCFHGTFLRANDNTETAFCAGYPMTAGMSPWILRRPIVECSYFDPRGQLDLHSMKEQATIICIDPKTKKIGFIRRGDEKFEELIKAVHEP